MRILVFSWRDPKHPLAGGAEQVMHEHMRGWIAAGHSVTLFSSKFKNVPVEEAIDDIYIVRHGYQYLGVQISAFFYYLKNRKKYDLIVDQFHGLPFFTPIYIKKPKLAVIQEIAREVWFLNPLPWPLNWVIGVIGFLGEPLIFFLYKNIPFMTGSESAKADVAKFGIPKDHITVVPHGVIVKKPSPMPPKEKKMTLAFLGVLSKDKGIEDTLKCFALLNKKGNFQFWVIGRVETEGYYKKLQKLVLSLGLKNKIKFWGFVSQEKKFELLARAHLLINPSVREGWGLVNIEANSMGTPVIAYKSPGLVDSVMDGQSGIICQKNTPLGLAEKVMVLLFDNVKLQKLQRSALAWSQNFTWEKSIRKSLLLIEKVTK